MTQRMNKGCADSNNALHAMQTMSLNYRRVATCESEHAKTFSSMLKRDLKHV
jgi:hypothetical protein